MKCLVNMGDGNKLSCKICGFLVCEHSETEFVDQITIEEIREMIEQIKLGQVSYQRAFDFYNIVCQKDRRLSELRIVLESQVFYYEMHQERYKNKKS